ncbi:hypothetical protein HK102_012462, partial [Quaeritorhiza haematococci]
QGNDDVDEEDKPQPLLQTLRGHEGAVKALSLISPTELLSVGFDGQIQLWDPYTSLDSLSGTLSNNITTPRHTFSIPDLHSERPWCVSWIPTHNTIVLGVTTVRRTKYPPLRLYTLTPTGIIPQKNLTGHKSSVYGLCQISDHTFASGSYDGCVRIYDARCTASASSSSSASASSSGGGSIACLEDPDDYAVYSVASNGSVLVSGTSWHSVVRTWDLRAITTTTTPKKRTPSTTITPSPSAPHLKSSHTSTPPSSSSSSLSTPPSTRTRLPWTTPIPTSSSILKATAWPYNPHGLISSIFVARRFQSPVYSLQMDHFRVYAALSRDLAMITADGRGEGVGSFERLRD